MSKKDRASLGIGIIGSIGIIGMLIGIIGIMGIIGTGGTGGILGILGRMGIIGSIGTGGRMGIGGTGGDVDTVAVARDTARTVAWTGYREPTAKDSVAARTVTRRLALARLGTRTAKDGAAAGTQDESLEARGESQGTQGGSRDMQGEEEECGDGNLPPWQPGDSGSAAVEIPITQKRYEGDGYRAYVSGYEARLDSIFVSRETTTIRETATVRTAAKGKKWHLGVSGGWGMGTNGWQPYVGVGVTYSIVAW